jgi:hypothetical protein
MSGYFKTPEHLFFTINKVLRSNGYLPTSRDEANLKAFTDLCFAFDNFEDYHCNLASQYYHDLKPLIINGDKFNFQTVFEESKQTVIDREDSSDEDEYYLFRTFIDIDNTPEETLNKLEELKQKSGIYFLYNDSELVYIGKSKGLGSRIMTSMKDRPSDSFRYLLTETISDAHIIEPYLIAKYKPKLNSEFKEEDDPTFEIPIPKKCDKTYKVVRRKVGSFNG